MDFIPVHEHTMIRSYTTVYCVTEFLFVICNFTGDKYRITVVLKVETDIITSLIESLIG